MDYLDRVSQEEPEYDEFLDWTRAVALADNEEVSSQTYYFPAFASTFEVGRTPSYTLEEN